MVKKSNSKKSSSKKSNEKTNTALTITLWVLFVLSIAGLIVSIVIQCKNEHFEDDDYNEWEKKNLLNYIHPASGPSINKEPGDPIKRCDNTDSCQNPEKFPSNVRDDYKMNKFYPVLASKRTTCNPVSKAWLEYASEEDIKNLTVDNNGVRYMCNRSCPPSVTACGLNDFGISNGVM